MAVVVVWFVVGGVVNVDVDVGVGVGVGVDADDGDEVGVELGARAEFMAFGELAICAMADWIRFTLAGCSPTSLLMLLLLLLVRLTLIDEADDELRAMAAMLGIPVPGEQVSGCGRLCLFVKSS